MGVCCPVPLLLVLVARVTLADVAVNESRTLISFDVSHRWRSTPIAFGVWSAPIPAFQQTYFSFRSGLGLALNITVRPILSPSAAINSTVAWYAHALVGMC